MKEQNEVTVGVNELREGDEFHADGRYHYTVLAAVKIDGELVAAQVRFADGGTGLRQWDKGTTITVRRERT